VEAPVVRETECTLASFEHSKTEVHMFEVREGAEISYTMDVHDEQNVHDMSKLQSRCPSASPPFKRVSPRPSCGWLGGRGNIVSFDGSHPTKILTRLEQQARP